MPTVIHQLADAFLKRKEAAQRKSVFPEDSFMPKSSKQDLANRLSVFEQGGTTELLKQAGKEMYENPVVNTAISLTPGAGDIQSGYEAYRSAREGNYGEAGLNALGVLPFVPALGGILAGKGAKTADLAKLAMAENLAKSGASREEIWNQTGWFQGPDKQWKFEIPDYPAFTKGAGTLENIAGKRGAEMGKVLHHPELMKAYPEIKDIPLQFREGKGGEYGTDLFGDTRIRFGSELEGKSVPLHELQHHIQGVEDFARGGNPTWMSNELSDLYMGMKELENTSRFQEGKKRLAQMITGLTDKTLSKADAMKEWEHIQNNYPELKAHDEMFGQIKELNPEATRLDLLREWNPEKSYYRLAGEEEARLVQKRMEMTPEELKANPPWTMYDTPESGQIVRFDRVPSLSTFEFPK